MSTNAIPSDPDRGPRPVLKRKPTVSRFQKTAAWVAGIMSAVTLLSLIATWIVFNSASFHSYLIHTVEKQASESLGVRVRLQNYALRPSMLGLDLYGITVDGANPYPQPPLLQVAHAEASVRIVSALRGKWYLDSVRIDQPVVQIFVDSHGVSNLPTLKSSGKPTDKNEIFDLGIRHAVLDGGFVFYNSRPSNIDLDLRDLELASTFDPLQKKYSGKLAYADGHILYGAYQPMQHSLDAQFEAAPNNLHLKQAKLSIAGSQLVLAASLTNFNDPTIQAHYDATLDGAELRKVLRTPSLPSGLVHAAGDLKFHQALNQSALQAIELNGDLNSRQIGVETPSMRAAINDVVAHYSLANGSATLESFRASLFGGQITGAGAMTNLGGASHGNVSANLQNVSLAQLKQALGKSAATPGVGVAGVLNADASATWGKTFDDLLAHANATINGQVTGARVEQVSSPHSLAETNPEPGPIPVNSALHAAYNAGNKQLTIDQSFLRTAQTNLTMNGTVSNRSSLNLRLQANDLREVEAIANLFRTPTPGHPVQPLGLAGAASFQGTVQGSTAAPRLTGQLNANNLELNGTRLKVLRTGVDISPSSVSLQNAQIQPASQGNIALNATAGLRKWALIDSSPLQIDLHASQLKIDELTRLAGQQLPITGILNANVTLHGTKATPKGNGDLALTKVNAYDEPVQTARVTFQGTADEAHGNLSIQLPAGSLQGIVSVRPKQKTYTAQFSSTGIHLEQLQALKARNVDAAGVVALNAQGQGTFDNPQMDATIQIPRLQIQKQTVSRINLHMNVANHVGNATLTSAVLNTSIQAKARVELTGDYPTDATLDTEGIPLQPLLAIYSPAEGANVSGQTEVHATLHGPLKDKTKLEAHVTIPQLKLAYGNTVQLAAASPIHVDYKNGVVDVQRSSIRGTDTDIQFQGSIPTTTNGAMSLLLQGTVNLQLAQLFDPDIRTAGQLKFNIDSHGPVSASDIGGEIDIVDASYASGDLPVGLQHGNGVLTMTTNRINVSKFEGAVGGGKVTAQGGVAFRPGVQFDLGLAAKGIRMLYPQGMRESIDANLRLAGTTDNATLGGAVNLSDLSFTPAFDLTSFAGQFSGTAAAPPSQGFAQNLQLNVALHSTNNVNLVSRALSLGGSANLQVRGTAADPVVLGRVNLTSGDIILNGTRFVLNGGTIQFVNPAETEPVVNATLTTTIQEYNINLRFNGPVAQMHTEYSSDPALPSADIINLLAFGKTTEASANASPTPANQAAESLIASQVSSQVTSRVSKVAGISQLSINPVLSGSSNQGPPGANITIQQRVTGNLFVTFSTNVASTQSQIIQGQYQVTPRVAVSATRDQNGGFAVDTLIKKSW